MKKFLKTRYKFTKLLTGQVVVLALLLIGVISLSGSPLFAADEPNQQNDNRESTITLSPVIKRSGLDSGSVSRDSFTVINNGQTSYDFIVYSRPYSVKAANYEADYTSTPPRSDAYSWVQFDKTNYHLDPGQRLDVGYTVRVPANVAPGGHYGVLFAEVQPAENLNQSGVLRKKRVGTLLYTNVNGETTHSGEIKGVKTDFWQTEPPIKTTVTLTNEGNVDETGKALVTVRDLLGQTKYSYQREFSTFPGKNRDLELAWDNSPWFGLFNVETKTDYLGKSKTESHLVLVMPRWLPITMLGILLIGVVYAAIRRRKR